MIATQLNKTTLVGFAAVLVVLALAVERQNAQILPEVDVGPSRLGANGRHVSVQLPAIMNMNLDTRGEHRGAKLDLSVLLKMVQVNLDVTRNTEGRLAGPVSVKVFGIPVYRSSQVPQTPAEAAAGVDSTLAG